ncbi:calpastatin isoform X3 [Calypte anna]|uniref:calpastatin isoform X3 n=1 Tax=Calypte anna TaxID=9244 RepID=UPI0011C4A677|nr:calpastatin isoform X3 [Calypte anna]
MSEPVTGRQPLPAAHGDKKATGASSKPEEEKAEASEKKSGSADVSQSKTPAAGAPPAVKKQSPSVDASKPQIMEPSETKPTPTTKSEPGKSTQPNKASDSQNEQMSEERKKEPNDGKSQTSPSVTATSEANNAGKVTVTQSDQPPQATSTGTAKPKPEMSVVSGTAGAGAAGTSVVTAAEKSSAEAGMDESALDSLIDTLGGPEDDVPTSPVYTGPAVVDVVSSTYLEELGKREGSLPPKYVEMLKKIGDGKDGVPPKANEQDEKPMTDDELAEALSSDFTCTAASAEEESLTEKKPGKEGEIVQAQAASAVKTSAPPKEKKPKPQEEVKDDAMEALLDTLGGPQPEPKADLGPVVEVSEAKAKEKKEEKPGERDDAIPPEYRLTPELDKDGKPILPKPEDKPKPLSDSDLVDELSKDFSCPAQPAVQPSPPKPSSTPRPADPVAAKPTEDEEVPRGTACSVQSAAPSAVSPVGHAADEALEALSSSLGQREPDPDEKKPVVDKVKEKTKQEERKKLGEDEETIPPEYRLTEAKDKDGKPLLSKPEEKPQPMSENDLLEGLTKGFSSSPSPSASLPKSTVIKKTKEAKKPTGSSDVISAATVSSVHTAAPLAFTSGGKEMDEALDLLSDSLGQREPDPDENKPVVDKVKEKAKSEHRDKLGERDDTIPPDYRKMLESGEQGNPAKATAEDNRKQKGKKKPTDDSAAIDALSGDFDTPEKAPAPPQHSKCRTKVGRKPSPRNQPQRKKENPKTLKRQGDSPPAANLRSRKQAKR